MIYRTCFSVVVVCVEGFMASRGLLSHTPPFPWFVRTSRLGEMVEIRIPGTPLRPFLRIPLASVRVCGSEL